MGIGQFLPALASLPQMFFQQQAENRARRENEGRYDEGLGIIRGHQSIEDPTSIISGYVGAEKMLEGLGQQERQDINRQYENFGAQVDQNMVSRGLSGTTIAPTMQMGVQRERRDALGRQEERLRREKLGARYNTLGTRQGLMGSELQWIGGREDVYPQQYDYTQAGHASAGSPSYPSGTDGLFGGLIGGGAAAAGVGLGALLAAPATGGASLGFVPFYSDRRLKKNIKPIKGAVDKVKKLNGVTWDWNNKAGAYNLRPGERSAGVIAQDVERVSPRSVVEDRGAKRVSYTDVTGLLVEAVKELAADRAA